MISPSPFESESLAKDVALLRERVRELEGHRRTRGAFVLLLGLTVSGVAFAQLKSFLPNSPALANDVNGNFTQLKTWLEQKVGAAGNAEVRVQTGPTSNVATAAGTALFVSGATSSPTQSILEVRHDNLTQGIGIGYSSINMVGTAGAVDLTITASGAGAVKFNSLVDIGLERVECHQVPSATICNCPAGKRLLGGGSNCTADNWHVNSSLPNSDTSWQAWCEAADGTNEPVDIFVLCARVR